MEKLYFSYLAHYGAWIGLGAKFESIPVLPHGFYGIFVSNNARVGKNVVIFHQVTIGSNTIKGSKGNGAPIIGDGVYIGCGAKIIGGVELGDNVRVGANCVVVKDVPANSVVIIRGIETIHSNVPLVNGFVPNNYFK